MRLQLDLMSCFHHLPAMPSSLAGDVLSFFHPTVIPGRVVDNNDDTKALTRVIPNDLLLT